MERAGVCALCQAADIVLAQEREADSLWRCRNCGVVFAWPQIEEKNLEAYYDEVTDPRYLLKYEEESFRRGKKILLFLKKKQRPGRVLDVGCGCGFFLKLAQEAGWQPEGVEISRRAIELSKNYGNFNIHRGEFFEEARKLPPFSAISLQHVLEHIKNPLKFLGLVREKLEPSGIIAVAVPNYDSWMRVWAGLQWVCLKERGHLFHFTPRALLFLLERSGFQILKWETPQWNSLDLIWAWRRKKKKQRDAAPSLLKSEKEGSKPPAESLLRKIAARLFLPLAWLSERRGRGAEILVWAKKTEKNIP